MQNQKFARYLCVRGVTWKKMVMTGMGSVRTNQSFDMKSTTRRAVGFLLILGCITTLCSSSKIEINVNTGERKQVQTKSVVASPITASSNNNDIEKFDEWPSGHIDLSDVEIRNEGEDATGSMSPLDLMIRSFGKLPDEEQETIGFSALMRKAEESGQPIDVNDLYAIWNIRQAKLKEAMDAMSDAAVVLSGLIKALDNATQSAQIIANSELLSFDEEAALDTLYQLEDYLSDVDNARDFHEALGGWPSLISLLSPKPRWRSSSMVHSKEELTAAQDRLLRASAQSETPQPVRGMAALVIGTAIKNEAKYSRWVLESVVRSLDVTPVAKENVKDVKLEDTVVAALIHMLEEADISHSVQRQVVYAIGSGIRQNMAAQAVFNALHGTNALFKALKGVEVCTENNVKSSWGLRTKLINLVEDFLDEATFEVQRPSDTMHGRNSAIIDIGVEMTSLEWIKLVATVGLEVNGNELSNVESKMHEAAIGAVVAQWKFLENSKSSTDKATWLFVKEQLLKLKSQYKDAVLLKDDVDIKEYLQEISAQIEVAMAALS
jgi:hypothetical protein